MRRFVPAALCLPPDVCARAGRRVGIHTFSPAECLQRIQQGFRQCPRPSRILYEFYRLDVLFHGLMYCKLQTNERFRFMGMSSDVRARPFNCSLRQRDACLSAAVHMHSPSVT